MSKRNRKIALIFDFDETLTADSVTQLLQKHRIDADNFWDRKHASLIQEGWDPTEAYLTLLVKEMKDRGKAGELRADKLREFGEEELELFEGVHDMFRTLRQRVSDNVTIQFFVISGGLQEVIAGALDKELTDYWACTLDDGGVLGMPYPKNVVSFTEKTKYLFQINKGLIGARYKNKPYEVNEFVEPRARAIPLENMIYVGDGLTDVPCFSILKDKGYPIVVYNQELKRRAGIQRALQVARHRALLGPYKANYRRGSSLRNLIEELCLQLSEAT